MFLDTWGMISDTNVENSLTIGKGSVPAARLPILIKSVVDGSDKTMRGVAFAELRKNAGLSQSMLGNMISRTAANVATWENGRAWPPPEMIRLMLERAFKIAPELLAEHYRIEVNEDLTGQAYIAGDPAAIEAHYFLTERGAVLQALTDRAKLGDIAAIKCWYERMEKTAAELSARDTQAPRQIEGAKAAEWTRRALRPGVGGRGMALDAGGEEESAPNPTPAKKSDLTPEPEIIEI